MSEEVVDQHARDTATRAAFELEKHADVCSERYKALDIRLANGQKRMEALKDGQDRIFGLIIAGGVATLSTLAGATWWLTTTLVGTVARANGIVLP